MGNRCAHALDESVCISDLERAGELAQRMIYAYSDRNITVDAADIVLVDDEVRELSHLVALSKRMMTTIRLNMTFSMTLNFIAIALAIIGNLDPVIGALVHNAGSVLVITNSAFLLNWKSKTCSSKSSASSSAS